MAFTRRHRLGCLGGRRMADLFGVGLSEGNIMNEVFYIAKDFNGNVFAANNEPIWDKGEFRNPAGTDVFTLDKRNYPKLKVGDIFEATLKLGQKIGEK